MKLDYLSFLLHVLARKHEKKSHLHILLNWQNCAKKKEENRYIKNYGAKLTRCWL